MYMKQGQILQIREAVEEIKTIASMENTDLKLSKEDAERVRLWAMWFTTYAYKIKDALNGEIDDKYR